MNKLKIVAVTMITALMSLAPMAAPAVLLAESGSISDGLCSGASLSVPSSDPDCTVDNDAVATGVNDTVKLVIDIFSWIVGVVSVIMIIYGGFKYITSGGDTGSVTAAKNTILYAIVGLIIVALAQVIVKFVLGNVTNTVTG